MPSDHCLTPIGGHTPPPCPFELILCPEQKPAIYFSGLNREECRKSFLELHIYGWNQLKGTFEIGTQLFCTGPAIWQLQKIVCIYSKTLPKIGLESGVSVILRI